MAAVVERTYVPNTTGGIVDSTAVRGSSYFLSTLQSVLYFIFSIIETLILVRVILVFFGANYTGFAQFIYDFTKPLVSPFFGIFNTSNLINVPGFRLEWESIVAILIYAIIFAIITTLLNLFRNRY